MKTVIRRIKNPFEGRPQLRHILLFVFLLLVLFFSSWLFISLWAVAHLHDDLIARKYEGSLSEDLGFIVTLTSEVARKFPFDTPAEKQRTESIRRQLFQAKEHLESLAIPALPDGVLNINQSHPLEEIQDPQILLQALSNPRLADLPLQSLGLDIVRQHDLPSYPSVETSTGTRNSPSFVFIPAPVVDTSNGQVLSLRLRRELVFSKLAERYLRSTLATPDIGKLYQSYYIGCGDFVRIINRDSANQLITYSQKFPPLRSLVDRTYFRETRRASGDFRRSEPYIDVTGGGLVCTYSIFIRNKHHDLCGMIAVDRQLEPFAGLWADLHLGELWRSTRNAYATYDIDRHAIESAKPIGTELRTQLGIAIRNREHDIEGGIQRFEIGKATAFTVPIGGHKIACFIFDSAGTNRTYSVLVVSALFCFCLFLLMAWLDRSIQLDSDAARRLQEDIISNIQGGFVIVDSHGSITLSNSRFEAMVGGAAKGTPIIRFFSPESANEYSQLRERGGFEFAGRLRDKRGALKPVIITSAPLTFRGDRNKRMLIFIDSAGLEQTIARKFLNIFSHALKSPVHSIILIADLFRRKNAVAKFDYYYSQLEQKVREFTTLTDNVLRFSTLDIKEISVNKAPVNVARVLRAVLAAAGERAKARGLLLKENVSGELRAVADPELLHIVFNNLVDNALKYTPSGAITVETYDLGTTIRIVVADTGPGVRAAEREQIFDLFVQGTRHGTNSREGLGLGLYISRRYVEAMGGRLWYEPVLAEGSRPGEDELLAGSRFVVELPSQQGEHQDDPKNEDSAA